MRRLFFMAIIVNFEVGSSGAPSPGDIIYNNPGIAINKPAKVFREGVFQFGQGINYKIPSKGKIMFIPALQETERVTIIIK